MFNIPRTIQHIDSSVDCYNNTESDLAKEVRSYVSRKRRRKCVDFVGDWGVGKDSLALKILDMEIPDPKEERDHPAVRSGNTRNIRNARNVDENFDLIIRIIPGKYSNREREENFFDYFRPGDYEVDAFVFCFALNCSSSFYNLWTKWIPKAKFVLDQKMPIFMLVGTKCDLPEVAVDEEQVLHLKSSSGAVYYSRSSARENTEITRVRNMLFYILTFPNEIFMSTI